MNLVSEDKVKEVYASYADAVQEKLLKLRSLILDTAEQINIPRLDETLRWNEPSYIAKQGSTIRLSHHRSGTDAYAIFFSCSTSLVPTFRMVYGDIFSYEGKRAIVFRATDEVPEAELRSCIAAALQYHKVKNMPMLGI